MQRATKGTTLLFLHCDTAMRSHVLLFLSLVLGMEALERKPPSPPSIRPEHVLPLLTRLFPQSIHREIVSMEDANKERIQLQNFLESNTTEEEVKESNTSSGKATTIGPVLSYGPRPYKHLVNLANDQKRKAAQELTWINYRARPFQGAPYSASGDNYQPMNQSPDQGGQYQGSQGRPLGPSSQGGQAYGVISPGPGENSGQQAGYGPSKVTPGAQGGYGGSPGGYGGPQGGSGGPQGGYGAPQGGYGGTPNGTPSKYGGAPNGPGRVPGGYGGPSIGPSGTQSGYGGGINVQNQGSGNQQSYGQTNANQLPQGHGPSGQVPSGLLTGPKPYEQMQPGSNYGVQQPQSPTSYGVQQPQIGSQSPTSYGVQQPQTGPQPSPNGPTIQGPTEPYGGNGGVPSQPPPAYGGPSNIQAPVPPGQGGSGYGQGGSGYGQEGSGYGQVTTPASGYGEPLPPPPYAMTQGPAPPYGSTQGPPPPYGMTQAPPPPYGMTQGPPSPYEMTPGPPPPYGLTQGPSGQMTTTPYPGMTPGQTPFPTPKPFTVNATFENNDEDDDYEDEDEDENEQSLPKRDLSYPEGSHDGQLIPDSMNGVPGPLPMNETVTSTGYFTATPRVGPYPPPPPNPGEPNPPSGTGYIGSSGRDRPLSEMADQDYQSRKGSYPGQDEIMTGPNRGSVPAGSGLVPSVQGGQVPSVQGGQIPSVQGNLVPSVQGGQILSIQDQSVGHSVPFQAGPLADTGFYMFPPEGPPFQGPRVNHRLDLPEPQEDQKIFLIRFPVPKYQNVIL